MDDLISRQEAIDAAIKADMENHNGILSEKRARVFEEHIAILPSEQPEEKIVYCGECKYMKPNGRCEVFADISIRPSASDFCSNAERKDNETD